jgi:hypothetical protein
MKLSNDFTRVATKIKATEEIDFYQDGLPFEEITGPDNAPFTMGHDDDEELGQTPHPKWQNPFHQNENLVSASRQGR